MNWSISVLDDPLEMAVGSPDPVTGHPLVGTRVVGIRGLLSELFRQCWNSSSSLQQKAFEEGGRVARVALADYVARSLDLMNSDTPSQSSDSPPMQDGSSWSLRWEPLHRTTIHHSHYHTRRHKNRSNGKRSKSSFTDHTINPFILERTDVCVLPLGSEQDKDFVLHVFLRFFVYENNNASSSTSICHQQKHETKGDDAQLMSAIEKAAASTLTKLFFSDDAQPPKQMMMDHVLQHVATAVWQDRLRAALKERYNAVAFVANGSVLPRKSGASMAPMASPPALAFQAPPDEEKGASSSSPSLQQCVTVDMGALHAYLVGTLPSNNINEIDNNTDTPASTTQVTLQGLLIPRGVSLICGGGYHGKSTLLRCLAAGVYNKIPGDGREFCVTVDDAVTVRAEDGRYVHRCNVSAFISNLPTPGLDPTQFSTHEASGSTSQAANVSEAIEMGASAMLVDEDTSAANFMARDGRMRALVMDESITPLLYRVNGLYVAKGISSIVVVGGVGDWLDVPLKVILMDRYLCKDATAKAQSVSRQFSHGHVQYGGRGVVHRLDWTKTGTPIPRRPAVDDRASYHFDMTRTAVKLLEGNNSALALQQIADGNVDSMSLESEGDDDGVDDDERCMDLSRCEQLMGKKPQLYGCGLGVAYLLQMARQNPDLGLPDLLRHLDQAMDDKGLLGVIVPDGALAATSSNDNNENERTLLSATWNVLVESLGCAYRPRRFEVGQALTRWRGMILEAIPVEDDGSDAAAQAETERKKQELLAIWHSRRQGSQRNHHYRQQQPPLAQEEKPAVTASVAERG